MVSIADFTLDINGKRFNDMSVVVRQPFGTDYSKEPVEVETPTGSYNLKSWNHNAFHDAVEDYYRGFIGRGGSAIRVGKNVGIVMRRNVIVSPSKPYTFQIP